MKHHPLVSLEQCNKPKYNKSSCSFRHGTINHTEEIKEVFLRNIPKEKLSLVTKLLTHYQFSAIEFSNVARKIRIKGLTDCVPLYTLVYNKPHLLSKLTEDMV